MTFLPRRIQFVLIAVFGILFANSRPANADAYSFAVLHYPGSTVTMAEGINNDGVIFGHVTDSLSARNGSEFLYQNGSFSLFPGLVDINDSGMILANTPSGPGIFFQGQFTPLNVPGGVIAFNNTGTVLVTGGFVKNGIFTPINYPGSSSTILSGINDHDEVVGQYRAGGTLHGFLYKNGVYTTIDFPGSAFSRAFAINNNGVITGNYLLFPPFGVEGFVYEDGNFETLDAFNVHGDETGTFPVGINDFGVITGYYGPNLIESFVATPVPEAGTLGMVGTGLLLVAGAVRRRLCI